MKTLNHAEILLIEDSEYDAEMTMLALKDNHVTNNVLWFQDSEEALAFIFREGKYSQESAEHAIRLILLDLKMPKVNGLEILEKLKNNKKTKSIPVVMLTSSKEEKDIAKSYELGVNSYIVKPVEFDKFTKAIADTGLYWTLLNQTDY